MIVGLFLFFDSKEYKKNLIYIKFTRSVGLVPT